MNYFWVHNKFLNSSWTDEELFMNVYSFDQQCELFRNYWWIVHELFFFITIYRIKFLNSSWTVMVNCSWTLVHESTMRVFYELFMNCSWIFMNVHELHFNRTPWIESVPVSFMRSNMPNLKLRARDIYVKTGACFITCNCAPPPPQVIFHIFCSSYFGLLVYLKSSVTF